MEPGRQNLEEQRMDLQQDRLQGPSQAQWCPLPQSESLDSEDEARFLAASPAQAPANRHVFKSLMLLFHHSNLMLGNEGPIHLEDSRLGIIFSFYAKNKTKQKLSLFKETLICKKNNEIKMTKMTE